MNELIRQIKYLPICFSSQITKLDVHQMYQPYGIQQNKFQLTSDAAVMATIWQSKG